MTNEKTILYTYMKSPHGQILLARNEDGLTHISFQDGTHPVRPEKLWKKEIALLAEAADQLRAYFYGSLESFDLPLAAGGTTFQQAVWKALQSIPCGETVSYAHIARRIGKPKAVGAVGAANGRNPLPIVVPCHRVIGSDGRLTGYAGGVRIKAALLAHEKKCYGKAQDQLMIGA